MSRTENRRATDLAQRVQATTVGTEFGLAPAVGAFEIAIAGEPARFAALGRHLPQLGVGEVVGAAIGVASGGEDQALAIRCPGEVELAGALRTAAIEAWLFDHLGAGEQIARVVR